MTPARIAILSGALDSDARAFAAASGATDVRALSAFAKGVKGMGLWTNMVCWPLRSSQNAGTGTTAFSFGGLGVFNVTLTNGPTWGSGGITFASASTQFLNLPSGFGSANINYAGFGAASVTGTGTNRLFSIENGGSNNRNGFTAWRFGGTSNVAFSAPYQSLDISTSDADSSAAVRVMAFNIDGSNLFSVWKNSSVIGSATVTPGTLTTTANNVLFSTFNGVGSIALLIRTPTTTSQIGALYELYKSTLGDGLGLP